MPDETMPDLEPEREERADAAPTQADLKGLAAQLRAHQLANPDAQGSFTHDPGDGLPDEAGFEEGLRILEAARERQLREKG